MRLFTEAHTNTERFRRWRNVSLSESLRRLCLMNDAVLYEDELLQVQRKGKRDKVTDWRESRVQRTGRPLHTLNWIELD